MNRKTNHPDVIASKCIGCGLCMRVCPSFVLDVAEGKAIVVRGDWCIGCGHCGAICPVEAILHEATSLEIHPKPGPSPATTPEALQLLIREKRSVRVYRMESVQEETLRRVLEAGRYAPTGKNSQNVHYVVLTSPERIEQLRQMTTRFYDKILSRVRGRIGAFLLGLFAGRKIVESLRESLPKVEYAKTLMEEGKDCLFYRAPAIMIVHAESWDTCSAFNCGAALYNCSLMAHALGLGCCFNWYLAGAVNHDRKIKKWLEIPGDHHCYGAMTLGYPDVKYERLTERKPVSVKIGRASCRERV
jgi:nitroreductase/Pyruvate/2-oxoacid:ferredoxin oxidoreductase delta subunit